MANKKCIFPRSPSSVLETEQLYGEKGNSKNILLRVNTSTQLSEENSTKMKLDKKH